MIGDKYGGGLVVLVFIRSKKSNKVTLGLTHVMWPPINDRHAITFGDDKYFPGRSTVWLCSRLRKIYYYDTQPMIVGCKTI